MTGQSRGRTGLLADPVVRQERARKGGLARTTLDHHITKLIDAAASLTDEQRDRLIAALTGGAR
ncbi:hypothetical protein AB0M46_50820 [Dactylosporangium sp. NPDC051485]|uniref:hypothetical protein n=1 Tax=Dactylosporangium sp. NPDC051485 TaxID=3154846 RepID=UPI00343219B3